MWWWEADRQVAVFKGKAEARAVTAGRLVGFVEDAQIERPAQPIGIWDEVREDATGLWVKGRLLRDVEKGREAAALLAAGAIDGLSIGYRTVKAERDGKGQRLLQELELWEVSLVTFPMLPEARVSAKSDALEDEVCGLDELSHDGDDGDLGRLAVVEQPLGEIGELCVKGPQVMKGYWQRQEATDEMLDSEGWLKTGDIALIQPDGYMRIVDRKKDMILVSGFNVYPNELEDVLATLPGVLQCAAIGVPDEKSGEAIKIFIVAKPGVTLTKEQVMTHMRANVTGYKVPKAVEFRDALPTTNVGKILRRELRDEELKKLGVKK